MMKSLIGMNEIDRNYIADIIWNGKENYFYVYII